LFIRLRVVKNILKFGETFSKKKTVIFLSSFSSLSLHHHFTQIQFKPPHNRHPRYQNPTAFLAKPKTPSEINTKTKKPHPNNQLNTTIKPPKPLSLLPPPLLQPKSPPKTTQK
ncbi:hypothetical protein AABB24_037143, partial [Solanum stoloniferum]